jgi:thymidylate kinase
LQRIPKRDKTVFISFSGIDGAGKSTQILALCQRLAEHGLRVRQIAFWDEIARMTRLRESAGHSIFKGDRGVGSPSAPINRRDKNVRSWPMSCFRLFLYFIDALSARAVMNRARRSDVDVVVLDRAIFDELANLTLSNQAIRVYVRLILAIVPRPDISFVLDADPVQARARKPEYPIEFLRMNRQAYLDLNELAGGITVIAPLSVEEVKREILKHAMKHIPFGAEGPASSGDAAFASDSDACASLSRPVTDPAA